MTTTPTRDTVTVTATFSVTHAIAHLTNTPQSSGWLSQNDGPTVSYTRERITGTLPMSRTTNSTTNDAADALRSLRTWLHQAVANGINPNLLERPTVTLTLTTPTDSDTWTFTTNTHALLSDNYARTIIDQATAQFTSDHPYLDPHWTP